MTEGRLTRELSPPNAPKLGTSRTLASPAAQISLQRAGPLAMDSTPGTVARLSYAPATQTTVVTTTKTTTTSFPPFSVKAPRDLSARSRELYPLASSPTPRTIKRLRLNIGGKLALFEEADDPVRTLTQYSEQQAQLHANQGNVVSTTDSFSRNDDPNIGGIASRGLDGSDQDENQVLRNRSATPISMSDATELGSFHCRNARAANGLVGSRRATSAATLGPSPELSSDDERYEELASPFAPLSTVPDEQTAPIIDVEPTEPRRRDLGIFNASIAGVEDSTRDSTQASSVLENASSSSAIQYGQRSLPNGLLQSSSRTNIPPHISTSPPNDASLPSPSLSPIRAAANLQNKLASTKMTSPAPEDLRDSLNTLSRQQVIPETPDPTQYSPLQVQKQQLENSLHTRRSATSPFAEIPFMLDTFDDMPDEMKTYVMFHLLKRCPKPTLHFVTGVIDPAMRCDFLARLPLELGLNITQHLDAQSMCNAAQVSRKWRHIVDSDEKAWKALIERDGFVISQEEICKAISEGWGWRISPMMEKFSTLPRNISSSDRARIAFTTPPEQSGATDPDRAPGAPTKRKRTETSGPHFASGRAQSSKKLKRETTSSSERSTPTLVSGPPIALMEIMESAAGPNAIASAAAATVPNPGLGLTSLQNLHFHKSIYQKHHILRSNWMKPTAEPLHLAFKARQRHVVTCLQFDDDKILTGSDDSFIDVYDTKTGASIRRLSGHEGGVWALEYQGNLLVSGSTDRTVRVWDMGDGRLLHTFQGHTSTVRCLQILQPVKIGHHPDGKLIVMPRYPLIITGSRDSSCRVWRLPKLGDRSMSQTASASNDVDNPYFLRALFGHSNSVRAIAAHGDTLVSGSYDNFVRVWKISTGECLSRLHGHSSKVYSVVLDSKRNRCISGSMDNTVKVWSLDTYTCLFNLDGHTSLVGLLDLRDDVLVSAAADATLRVWDPATGHCQHQLTAHTGAITCFLHDGQKIISGSDRALKMWDTKSGECVRDLLTDLSGVWQIKFDDRRCIAAVQRSDWTYIEVLDFGACRDDVPQRQRGQRIVVDARGRELAKRAVRASLPQRSRRCHERDIEHQMLL